MHEFTMGQKPMNKGKLKCDRNIVELGDKRHFVEIKSHF
jgi:hypothetical protein